MSEPSEIEKRIITSIRVLAKAIYESERGQLSPDTLNLVKKIGKIKEV